MPASDLHGRSGTIKGPKAGSLPPSGAGGSPQDLPYSKDRGPLLAWLGGTMALVVVVAAIVILALNQSGSDNGQATAPRPSNTVQTGKGEPTTVPSTPAPTTVAPATTAAAPVPTTSAPPPVPQGPVVPHRAEYHDGKLFLEGSIPDKATSDAFAAKAAAVIGPQNVINNYVIDPRAPVPTDGRVVVADKFVFPTGSAAIDPSYSNILQLGVAVMQLNPQVVMVVVGHTDDVGDPAANQQLSEARANAVVDYLVAKGIDRSRFRPSGRGQTQPAASNATPEGQAQNRRIEVTLLNLLA